MEISSVRTSRVVGSYRDLSCRKTFQGCGGLEGEFGVQTGGCQLRSSDTSCFGVPYLPVWQLIADLTLDVLYPLSWQKKVAASPFLYLGQAL
jgi:hypothetical protein